MRSRFTCMTVCITSKTITIHLCHGKQIQPLIPQHASIDPLTVRQDTRAVWSAVVYTRYSCIADDLAVVCGFRNGGSPASLRWQEHSGVTDCCSCLTTGG